MIEKFWQSHPALFYAFAALLGCFAAFMPTWLLFLPLTLFFTPAFSRIYLLRLSLALLISVGFFIYCSLCYRLPDLPEEGAAGVAYLHINSISYASSHYGKQWIYKGKLKNFISDETQYNGRELPVKLTLKTDSNLIRPLADRDYLIKGHLKRHLHNAYFFLINKEDPWTAIPNSWSLAEWRHRVKKNISSYIKERIPDRQAASFLTGIATGEFDDKRMQFEFSRFGLQHIMAISGFHFAIVASVLGILLKILISPKKAIGALIFLITLYFIILGPSPSVLRAWLTILVALCGFIFNKKGNGLNSLGFAMLLILLYEPLMCCEIGFQLSFLATAAILLLFNGVDYGLQKIFIRRPLSQAILMNPIAQHGYLFLNYCRQGAALSLAVNAATLPLVFFYFHKFSLMSLLYNLFFPFMVSISMLLMISALTLSFTPLGELIHGINNYYTAFMLNYIYNMPQTIDKIWTINDFPFSLVSLSLTLIFHCGIWVYCSMEKQREKQRDFAYL